MKFTSALVAFALAASSVVADPVRYDQTYDQKAGSLLSVACSNGENGLYPRYETFGDLPGFPYIGGAAAVTHWDSDKCGSCWKLTYTNTDGNKKSIYVTAVDFTATGFNIALTAMNDLTEGHAVDLGVVDVVSEEVDPSACGF
ncbi:secreted protein 1 [Macrolepiota fuliginosa MF-IS2]|uniref:Secreted protein 1 n=1 Tax=Macrolepiota fuliginosa MF-IS2 TaxID=1400762 RepID=A0A9P6C657_9AGAR|nr:secreted protein 1 [Macrolepiota fuliginosa MF-IS2]